MWNEPVVFRISLIVPWSVSRSKIKWNKKLKQIKSIHDYWELDLVIKLESLFNSYFSYSIQIKDHYIKVWPVLQRKGLHYSVQMHMLILPSNLLKVIYSDTYKMGRRDSKQVYFIMAVGSCVYSAVFTQKSEEGDKC